MKARTWGGLGLIVIAGAIAAGYEAAKPTYRFATEAEMRKAAPSALLVQPIPNPDAQARYSQLSSLGQNLSSDNDALAEDPTVDDRNRLAEVNRPFLHLADRLLSDGPLQASTSDESSGGSISGLRALEKAWVNQAELSGARGDSPRCAAALASALRLGTATRKAGGVIWNYLVAIACDAIALREVANCTRRGWLRRPELRLVLKSVPRLGDRDQDLADALRSEWRHWVFNPKESLLGFQAMLPKDPNVLNESDSLAGNLDVLRTEKQLSDLAIAEVANAERSWPRQLDTPQRMVSEATDSLPKDPESGAQDDQAVQKGSEFAFRISMNRIPNSFGRAMLSALADTDAKLASTRMACNHELVCALLAIQLYRDDHNGARPETLAVLLKDGYLPSLPVDFFVDRPLRYNPIRGAVYSVGQDMKDDGGQFEHEAMPMQPDFGYFLAAPKPAGAPKAIPPAKSKSGFIPGKPGPGVPPTNLPGPPGSPSFGPPPQAPPG